MYTYWYSYCSDCVSLYYVAMAYSVLVILCDCIYSVTGTIAHAICSTAVNIIYNTYRIKHTIVIINVHNTTLMYSSMCSTFQHTS